MFSSLVIGDKHSKCMLVLILVVLTVVAGCTRRGGGDTSDPCRCPTLVETAPTIDFIGDGQTPIKVSSNWLTGPRPLSVGLEYNVAYSDERVIEIAERFTDAGFTTNTDLEPPLKLSPHFVEDEWEAVIDGVTRDGVGSIRIVVRIVEPDRDAAETLAPLIDALGTIP
ncbi:MAG: hypothetical protein BMS9Abin12_1989 [Acidimicrobiia bacterium]|nr:MAG: hypothetical protein BMS9Abin12_1989 [Acidimicrobiia bacterium]